MERVHKIGALRAELDFELDGVVIKADSPADQAQAGIGSSRLRRSFWATQVLPGRATGTHGPAGAYKFPAAQKITVLRAVERERR
ncbi:hypothetical protein ACU686_07695 [Yinghuangia aomiensis]